MVSGDLQSVEKSISGASSRPDKFPFLNSSYPGEQDGDVLPYPAHAARHGKRSQKSENKHFFLLTSEEAYEHKLKEKQIKIEKENEK